MYDRTLTMSKRMLVDWSSRECREMREVNGRVGVDGEMSDEIVGYRVRRFDIRRRRRRSS
jgi:hypothetical protein